MKLRLLPRHEDAYVDLFQAAADTIVTAANTLLNLLGDLANAEALAKQLVDLEHEGDRITRDILTRLATTFIASLDRDEIYDLAKGLDDVNDAIEEVGDLTVLHGISQPLPGALEQTRVLVRAAEHTAEGMRCLSRPSPERMAIYLMAIETLERDGDRLHRRVVAELYEFTGEHPAQHVLRWKDITDGLEEALNNLARVAYTVQSVVIKHV
jgi:predicted phosphate transport protein (TIGR00153 family)